MKIEEEEEPTLTFEQIAKDASERLNTNVRSYRLKQMEQLHPTYSKDSNMEFAREMYRLIGFSYLGSQKKLDLLRQNIINEFNQAEQNAEDMLLVQKAASNFQKALGDQNGEVIHELYTAMRK